MKNENEYHSLTEDKGVLKRIVKSSEGEIPKDNQEVEGNRIVNHSPLYRKIRKWRYF